MILVGWPSAWLSICAIVTTVSEDYHWRQSRCCPSALSDLSSDWLSKITAHWSPFFASFLYLIWLYSGSEKDRCYNCRKSFQNNFIILTWHLHENNLGVSLANFIDGLQIQNLHTFYLYFPFWVSGFIPCNS